MNIRQITYDEINRYVIFMMKLIDTLFLVIHTNAYVMWSTTSGST